MPKLPLPPLSNGIPLDAGPLPVSSSDDVDAVWSPDIPTPDPTRDAIVGGQAAMLLAHQKRSRHAAAQSDPLRASDEYLDAIGEERKINRKPSEDNRTYRARVNASPGTVSPNAIVAAVNAVLAPYTTISCRYFEQSDALFSQGSTLQATTRAGFTQPSAGTPVTVAVDDTTKLKALAIGTTLTLVGTLVGSPTPTTIGRYALTAVGTTAPTITLQAATSADVLVPATAAISAGAGVQVLPAQTGPWSAHAFSATDGGPNATPNYPDRRYAAIPNRRPSGLVVFQRSLGRLFVLRVPDISGIDANVSAAFQLGRGIQARTTASYVQPDVATHTVAVSVDDTSQLAAGDSVTVQGTLSGVPTPIGLYIVSAISSTAPIVTLDLEVSGSLLVPATTVVPAGASLLTLPQEQPAGNAGLFPGLATDGTNAKTGMYVWSISSTSDDVYQEVIDTVESIRGHSIRWSLIVDSHLTS